MKYLELTQNKAIDLNHLCDFAIKKGINSPFDPIYYSKQSSELDINYIYHLIDVARQYEVSPKILDLTSREINATHNTEEFLKSGGFIRVLQIEKREDKIQELTLRHLTQSVFATKDWWKLTLLTVFLSALLSSAISRLIDNRKYSTTKEEKRSISDSTKEVISIDR